MELIRWARKQRETMAIENGDILLKELDLEKSLNEEKRMALKHKKEKKRGNKKVKGRGERVDGGAKMKDKGDDNDDECMTDDVAPPTTVKDPPTTPPTTEEAPPTSNVTSSTSDRIDPASLVIVHKAPNNGTRNCNTRGSVEVASGPVDNTRGSADNTRGSVDNTTGSVYNTRGPADNTRGSVDNTRGSVYNTRGPVDNIRGSVYNTRRPVDNTRGSVDNTRGPVDNTRGSVENAIGSVKYTSVSVIALRKQTSYSKKIKNRGGTSRLSCKNQIRAGQVSDVGVTPAIVLSKTQSSCYLYAASTETKDHCLYSASVISSSVSLTTEAESNHIGRQTGIQVELNKQHAKHSTPADEAEMNDILRSGVIGDTTGLVENKSTLEMSTRIGELDDFGTMPADAQISPLSDEYITLKSSRREKKGSKITTTTTISGLYSNVIPLVGVSKVTGADARARTGEATEGMVVLKKSGKNGLGARKKNGSNYKAIVIPAKAVSRIIGRNGMNIKYIKTVSGAQVDLQVQNTYDDAVLTVGGSTNALRIAFGVVHELIGYDYKGLVDIPLTTTVAHTFTVANNPPPLNVWTNSCTSKLAILESGGGVAGGKSSMPQTTNPAPISGHTTVSLFSQIVLSKVQFNKLDNYGSVLSNVSEKAEKNYPVAEVSDPHSYQGSRALENFNVHTGAVTIRQRLSFPISAWKPTISGANGKKARRKGSGAIALASVLNKDSCHVVSTATSYVSIHTSGCTSLMHCETSTPSSLNVSSTSSIAKSTAVIPDLRISTHSQLPVTSGCERKQCLMEDVDNIPPILTTTGSSDNSAFRDSVSPVDNSQNCTPAAEEPISFFSVIPEHSVVGDPIVFSVIDNKHIPDTDESWFDFFSRKIVLPLDSAAGLSNVSSATDIALGNNTSADDTPLFLSVVTTQSNSVQMNEGYPISYQALNDSLLQVTKGDSLFQVTKGDSLLQVTKGDSLLQVTKGDSLLQVTKCDSLLQVTKGDSLFQATKGDVLKKTKKDFIPLSEDNKSSNLLNFGDEPSVQNKLFEIKHSSSGLVIRDGKIANDSGLSGGHVTRKNRQHQFVRNRMNYKIEEVRDILSNLIYRPRQDSVTSVVNPMTFERIESEGSQSSLLSIAPVNSSQVSIALVNSSLVSIALVNSSLVSIASVNSILVSIAPVNSSLVSIAPVNSNLVSIAPVNSSLVSITPVHSSLVSIAPVNSSLVSIAPVNLPIVSKINSTLNPYAAVFTSRLTSTQNYIKKKDEQSSSRCLVVTCKEGPVIPSRSLGELLTTSSGLNELSGERQVIPVNSWGQTSWQRLVTKLGDLAEPSWNRPVLSAGDVVKPNGPIPLITHGGLGHSSRSVNTAGGWCQPSREKLLMNSVITSGGWGQPVVAIRDWGQPIGDRSVITQGVWGQPVVSLEDWGQPRPNTTSRSLGEQGGDSIFTKSRGPGDRSIQRPVITLPGLGEQNWDRSVTTSSRLIVPWGEGFFTTSKGSDELSGLRSWSTLGDIAGHGLDTLVMTTKVQSKPWGESLLTTSRGLHMPSGPRPMNKSSERLGKPCRDRPVMTSRVLRKFGWDIMVNTSRGQSDPGWDRPVMTSRVLGEPLGKSWFTTSKGLGEPSGLRSVISLEGLGEQGWDGPGITSRGLDELSWDRSVITLKDLGEPMKNAPYMTSMSECSVKKPMLTSRVLGAESSEWPVTTFMNHGGVSGEVSEELMTTYQPTGDQYVKEMIAISMSQSVPSSVVLWTTSGRMGGTRGEGMIKISRSQSVPWWEELLTTSKSIGGDEALNILGSLWDHNEEGPVSTSDSLGDQSVEGSQGISLTNMFEPSVIKQASTLGTLGKQIRSVSAGRNLVRLGDAGPVYMSGDPVTKGQETLSASMISNGMIGEQFSPISSCQFEQAWQYVLSTSKGDTISCSKAPVSSLTSVVRFSCETSLAALASCIGILPVCSSSQDLDWSAFGSSYLDRQSDSEFVSVLESKSIETFLNSHDLVLSSEAGSCFTPCVLLPNVVAPVSTLPSWVWCSEAGSISTSSGSDWHRAACSATNTNAIGTVYAATNTRAIGTVYVAATNTNKIGTVYSATNTVMTSRVAPVYTSRRTAYLISDTSFDYLTNIPPGVLSAVQSQQVRNDGENQDLHSQNTKVPDIEEFQNAKVKKQENFLGQMLGNNSQWNSNNPMWNSNSPKWDSNNPLWNTNSPKRNSNNLQWNSNSSMWNSNREMLLTSTAKSGIESDFTTISSGCLEPTSSLALGEDFQQIFAEDYEMSTENTYETGKHYTINFFFLTKR